METMTPEPDAHRACRSQPVAITMLHPSPTNPRKTFAGERFDQMVDSVRGRGGGMSGITDEQIEALAAKHLKYQEEGSEVSGVYAFARALLAEPDGAPATAADWPRNTCSASRHAAQIARLMARGDLNWLEDAHHVAESITATCEALWTARSELFGKTEQLPAARDADPLRDAYELTELTARTTDSASCDL